MLTRRAFVAGIGVWFMPRIQRNSIGTAVVVEGGNLTPAEITAMQAEIDTNTTVLAPLATPGADGEVLTVVGGVPDWAPPSGSSSPFIYVDDYLTTAQGTTDNSADIQTAFDDADAMVTAALGGGGNTGFPTVVFGPGDYRLDSPLTWKRHHVVGGGAHHGTRLQWNGAATTAIVRTEGMNFVSWGGMALNVMGANRPTYWMDLQGSVDFGGILYDIQFGNSSAGGVKMGGWFNCHWHDLRWDYVGGYAIDATIPAGMSLSTFRLDGFTYDHQEAAAGGRGFMKLTVGDVADIGTVKIANGRIEVNGAWVGEQAIVHINQTTNYNDNVGLHLDNVTYAGVGMANDVVVYRSGSASYWDSFLLTNFRQVGLSAIIGGTWPATMPITQLKPHYHSLSYGSASGLMAHRLALLTSSEAWDAFIWARKAAEAQDRWVVDNNGGMTWGDGTNAPDARLYRNAANSLAMGSGDNFSVDGSWNGGSIWLGNYKIWVDATGDLRISSGAPASDTAGTVIGTQS